MSKKSITIKDIAKRLNVSVATVSRALRDSNEIKKETKLAVLRIAKEMDYHPNLLASSLSSKKSKILGVIVPTINRQFWSNSISGIESIAYQQGYKVMIFQSAESFQKEVEIVEILANSMVDGILIAFSKETHTFVHIQHVIDRDIPVLLFERVSEEVKASMVVTDNKIGAKQIVQHLIEKGKKRIAYLNGPPSLGACQERLKGYKEALSDNGILFDESLLLEIPDFSYEIAEEGMKNLWNKDIKPDALFCFADILAIGAIHSANEMGIKIPQQLAIAGFGNDDTGKFISPSITTMAQPSFEMGKIAALLILEQINSEEETFDYRKEVIKPHLIVREST